MENPIPSDALISSPTKFGALNGATIEFLPPDDLHFALLVDYELPAEEAVEFFPRSPVNQTLQLFRQEAKGLPLDLVSKANLLGLTYRADRLTDEQVLVVFCIDDATPARLNDDQRRIFCYFKEVAKVKINGCKVTNKGNDVMLDCSGVRAMFTRHESGTVMWYPPVTILPKLLSMQENSLRSEINT